MNQIQFDTYERNEDTGLVKVSAAAVAKALLAAPAEQRMQVMLAMPDKSMAVEERKAREAADQRAADAERDARRMNYLGGMVRSRSSEEQAELNVLMRRYPPLAEKPPSEPAPAATESTFAVHDVVEVVGMRLRHGSKGTVLGFNSAGDGLWSVHMHEDGQTVRYPASELRAVSATESPAEVSHELARGYVEILKNPTAQARLLAYIDQCEARQQQAERDLKTANYWRERHSRDAQAAAQQSNRNWQRAQELEAERDRLQARVAELEGQLSDLAGDDATPGFGVDPGDSAALLKLRAAIDDVGEWPSQQAYEYGDYESAVWFMATELDLHRRALRDHQSRMMVAAQTLEDLHQLCSTGAPWSTPEVLQKISESASMVREPIPLEGKRARDAQGQAGARLRRKDQLSQAMRTSMLALIGEVAAKAANESGIISKDTYGYTLAKLAETAMGMMK